MIKSDVHPKRFAASPQTSKIIHDICLALPWDIDKQLVLGKIGAESIKELTCQV